MKKLMPVLIAILLVSTLLAVSCSSSSPTPSQTTAPPVTSAVPPPTSSAAPATSAAPAPTSSAPAPTTAPATTTSAPSGKTYKFSYNNFFPPTHNNSILAEMWMAEIKKRTNGAVTFNYLPGASLTAANKVYDGVLTGISDIGFSVVSYTLGRFPASELIEFPHGYPNGYVATMVSNDYYNQFKPVEFKDVHMFYFYATGPQVLFTTKKYITKLEDLKGLVLRSTGVGADIAKALGASGYAAAQNEAYELMSKGVIDGSIAPREVLLGWKQAEVVNYVTECYDVGSVSNMYVVMNKAKWDALPADIQKVFDDVSKQWIEYHAKVSSAYDQGGMEYFKTQQGRKEILLTPEESARWVAAMKPLVDKTLAGIKDKGLPADEYEKYIKDRIQYWTGKTVSDADCAAWVKDNVKKPQ
jgi:TRAP-type transport system periplasmic protein